jgi:4-amino-4-deoxy-L-arabinose transferase-like glycosyltransferase
MPSLAVADRSTLYEPPSLFARLFALVERSHGRACAALVALALVCFLPGFVSLQPMDRDEPRFAQASKQMLETGDFVDIRFQTEARHKKPVGIYWLQSAAVATAEAVGLRDARTTIAVYRVPSLLGALATVLLTYWAALAFLRRRDAFLAAAFMAASLILMVEARLAKTDAMLTACSVAAMGGLARAYLARGVARLPTGTVLVFWAAVAVGILIKGPMVVVFAGVPALVLSVRERSARWLLALRPGLGLAVLVAIVAPWFVAIALKTGGAFYAEAVGHDMLGKVGTAQTYHWAPPGFYFMAFFATFWPAAALAAIAAPTVWTKRRQDVYAFALAWTVPTWLILEAVPTKLPHYTLPLLPAVAIATVAAMARGDVGPHRWGAKAVALLMPFMPIGFALALSYGAWSLDETVPLAALPVLLAACVLSVVAYRLFHRGEVSGAALTNVAAAAVLAVGVFGLVEPVLQSLKVSPRLVSAARGAGCPGPQVATLGYREPSLVFLAGTGLTMLDDAAGAVRFLAGGGCRVVFVERRFEADFKDAVTKAGVQPALASRVAGFNINGGRRVDIGTYVVRP